MYYLDKMDPISIATAAASLAKIAFNAATSIYSAVNQVRTIDARIESFAQEIRALGDALTLIDSGFQDPALKQIETRARSDQNQVTYSSVHNSRIGLLTRSSFPRFSLVYDAS